MSSKSETGLESPKTAVTPVEETALIAAIFDEIDEEEGRRAYVPQPVRLRWATGGTRSFVEPISGDAIKDLEGVVAISRISKVFWRESFVKTGGGTLPDCYSTDGLKGSNREVHPDLICATCPYNQFGSAPNGRGKACRDMRRLIVIPSEGGVPYIINVPPSSLRSWDQYCTMVRGKGFRYYAVSTKLSLERATNKDNIEFSRLKPEIVGPLSYEKIMDLVKLRIELQAFLEAPITIEDVQDVNTSNLDDQDAKTEQIPF